MTSNQNIAHFESVKPGFYEIQGDLTFATVNQMHIRVKKTLKGQTESMISLNNIIQIDSAGLAFLIDLGNSTKNQQSIKFSHPNDQLLRLMDLYNLRTVLTFVE